MKSEELIIKLLSGNLSHEEFKSLYNFIKNILTDTLENFSAKSHYQLKNHLIKIYGNDYISVLIQEYFLMLLNNKRRFLELEYISNKYLKICAKNLINYLLSKKKTAISQQINFDEFMKHKNICIDSQDEVRIEEVVASEGEMYYLDKLSLKSLVDILKKNLTDKEIETFCAYLEKIFYGKRGIEKNKRDTYYKRWERLKPKLQKIFKDFLPELTALKKEGFSLIMSELCKRKS